MRRIRTLAAVAALTLLQAACHGGGTTTTGPSPTTPESGFLTGTWRGPVTIHREGLPDTTGTSVWTFVLVPLTGGTSYTATITLQHPYLPFTATGLSTSVLPAQPGGRINTQGSYPSPRGCQGVLGSAGTAQTDRIDATFDGSDCVFNPGPVGFTGSVTLSKDR
jgi:hypothetical protein